MGKGKNDNSDSGSGSGSNTSSASKTEKTVNLTYWGLWEPNSVLTEIINKYQQDNPGVTIHYIQETHKDYRERLQSSLQRGDGPDIFRYHATWFYQMLKGDLQPDSGKQIDMSRFFETINKDVVLGGQTFGVPLMFDNLALYYNPSLLQKAGVSVPTTWTDFLV